jgi:hypothetical protein
VWASLLVVVAGVAMGVLGALRSGISWDEPYHVMRLGNYFEHGWFALDWAVEGDGSTSPDANTVVYGPVAMLLLHGLTVLVGVEDWSSVATTPAAYDVRHLGVLLIGLAGTAAAATTTRILLGSWRWALVTAAALLALPMWTGHLMFNVKDVPVATGYTVMTLALVCMVAPVESRRRLRVGGLAAGIVLMVGTRPAMSTAVVAGLVVLAVGVAVAEPSGNARAALAEAAGGLAAAAAVLVLVYPNVFAHPANLIASAQQSADFREGGGAGLGYLPFYVVAQTPLLLLLLFAVGVVTAARFVRRHWRTDTSQATRLLLVGAQLAALPLVAVAKNSDLYNGLRQLLFASPAWAVLVTVGLAAALRWGRATGRARLVGAMAVLALAAPTADQALLFPYQYTYYNVALDVTGVHVQSDYWRTSVPELLPSIPTDGQIVCGPTRTGPEDDPSRMVAGRYTSDSSVDCRTDPLGPLSSAWTAERLPLGSALPHDTFYALIDRDHEVPANCTRLAAVDRDRHGRQVAMTYVARCRLDPAPLGLAPVAFESPARETNMVPELWAYAAEGWVMRESASAVDAEGMSASLTFEAPPACADRPCALVLDADGPADLVATVNDVPAEIVPAADPVTRLVTVRLRAGTSKAWVTLARRSGAPLGLRLHSIRVISETT